MRVVAIDGPSGSGKSTVARVLAERLGLEHLDTGAMYRAVTFAVLERDIDPADAPAVADVVHRLTVVTHGGDVTVDGEDASAAIRGPAVTGAVSTVAANPEVRRELVRRQREWIRKHGGGVVEGRDIGTEVWPDADLKVYLTAELAVRAARRQQEVGARDEGAVATELARRDERDSTRAASPLTPAADAVVVDTSGLSVEEIVASLLERLP